MKLSGRKLLLCCLIFAPFINAHANELKLEKLMSETLAADPGIEIIVSRVSIPSNSALPKHWHPGEEFAYILKGSVTLWQEGKDDTLWTQGQVAKVPLKQVHTAITGDEGVTLLVFRVHQKGQPERIKVE